MRNGCEVAETCLECPEDPCVYERPGSIRHYRCVLEGVKMEKQCQLGKSNKEIAQEFGVTLRTVQRLLKMARDEDGTRIP